MAAPNFHGVNASVPLPFDGRGRPDYDMFRSYLEWLTPQGIVGVTVNADTGEGAQLTRDERLAVVETARHVLDDDLCVVSGLIAASSEQGGQLAKDLARAGADALLVFSPPAFIGQPLPSALVCGYFEAIAQAGVPLVAFNLTPDLGGAVLCPGTLRELADRGLIAALKEASFDPVTYIASRDAIRSSSTRPAFLTGCDNFIYESVVLGADGCLLGFCALAAEMTVRLCDLVASGRLEEAERLNREALSPLAQAMFARPMRDSRARIKAGLARLGIFDNEDVRPPLLPLGEEDRAAMLAAMDTAALV
jgi:4-hydroxy-tetrahydrodipicolinate synthase